MWKNCPKKRNNVIHRWAGQFEDTLQPGVFIAAKVRQRFEPGGIDLAVVAQQTILQMQTQDTAYILLYWLDNP